MCIRDRGRRYHTIWIPPVALSARPVPPPGQHRRYRDPDWHSAGAVLPQPPPAPQEALGKRSQHCRDRSRLPHSSSTGFRTASSRISARLGEVLEATPERVSICSSWCIRKVTVRRSPMTNGRVEFDVRCLPSSRLSAPSIADTSPAYSSVPPAIMQLIGPEEASKLRLANLPIRTSYT